MKNEKKSKVKRILFVASIIIFLSLGYVYVENGRTIESVIKQQNFITVQPWYIYPYKISFDLEKKSYFSIELAEAVKENKIYEGYKHVRSNGNEKFEKNKAYTLYYPLIAINVTKEEVRHERFKVKRKVSKKYRQVIESLAKRFSTSEMIVIYNKSYLPVEIQLYDKVDKKWTMFAKYSYPYKNRQAYEKDLNDCIETVLSGAFGED